MRLVAGRLVYEFDSPAALLGVIAVFCYLTVGFTAMGLLLGGLVPTARAAQAVGLLIWFVMLMVGGAGPPREVLTGAMGYVSDATPLWYAVQMMHQPWLGLDPGPSWWVFTGIAVTSGGLALLLFRWEWPIAQIQPHRHPPTGRTARSVATNDRTPCC